MIRMAGNGMILFFRRPIRLTNWCGEENYRKAINGERSFKEVVEGLPHHQQIEDWMLKNPTKVEASNGAKNRMELDMLKVTKLKGMVLRVVEEVFKSDNMEEFKRNLGFLMVEALNEFLRNEDFLAEKTTLVLFIFSNRKGHRASQSPKMNDTTFLLQCVLKSRNTTTPTGTK